MGHAIFYTQASDVCAGMCTCNCMHQMEKTVLVTQAETKVIDAEISKLLKKGVIKPSIHEQGEYISPIFVTAKNGGVIDWF